MHVKKAIKQLLSLTLSFCLIITCVSSALATGVIHSKYDNNFTGPLLCLPKSTAVQICSLVTAT